jgi:pimeloyl-ACP methyl ester carboxylesterase
MDVSFKHILMAALALALTLPSTAQDMQDPLAGSWRGTLTVPGGALTLVFHFAPGADGSYTGTLDSPDQGTRGIPLGSVSLTEDEVVAPVPSVAGEYKGQLAGENLSGTWSQGGQSFPLNLERSDETAAPAPPATRPDTDVTGTWMGRLATPGGVQLRVVFHFEEGDDGALRGTLDSPDQGASGIPLGEISGTGSSMTVTVPSVGGTFEGTVSPDRSAIDGTWTQAGMPLPLRLEPVTDEGSLRAPERPQEPERPFPYREENVTFDNPDADVRLAGTLTLPEGDGPFPAAVLISGSGPQNRNEELLGHRPFLVLADHLTRQGIAVLRYDDRGVAESTGDFLTATSDDFASDASAAADYLKSRPEIASSRVGLVGHSEGGLIAPIVATRRPDLGYIVLMAGPGVSGLELIQEQAALISRAAAVDESRIQENLSRQREMFEIVMSDASVDEMREELRQFLRTRLSEMTEEERQESGLSEQTIEMQVEQISSPWWRFFLSYDPRPTLEKVSCPVLAITGEKDLQVAPYQNLPEIEKALKKGGNKKYRIVEMEGLNHLFQPSETGAPSEYSQIETTFSPEAMEEIANWILGAAS